MKEKKNELENSRPMLCISSAKNEKLKGCHYKICLSLYSAQVSKKTIIPSIPMIHEGQNWKNHKKKSNGGQKGKIKYKKKHFRTLL